MVMTFKSINGSMAHEYLCELVPIRKSARKLRSSSQILLPVAASRLKSYGNCPFSFAAITAFEMATASKDALLNIQYRHHHHYDSDHFQELQFLKYTLFFT